MEKFTTLTGIVVPLPMINVDTDMIIPKQFLRSIKRTGFGVNLFDEMRYTDGGKEISDFVLNKDPYRKAQILVTGKNFGCGSSREHAPWALMDFGFRCIIAPSFADIFYNNCFKNGILPVTLAQKDVDTLMEDAKGHNTCTLTVDLPNQTITRASGETIPFDIDPFRKKCLLEGLDDIALTLAHEDAIASHEEKIKSAAPWL